MLECCSLYKIDKFWIAKTGKIIKIPHFLIYADVSNKFAYVFSPNTLIKTKCKCQEEEKGKTENSI